MIRRPPDHNANTVSPWLLLSMAGVLSCAVAAIVSHHTIDTVGTRHLVPRWDLAAHLVNGWTDYYYLVTGAWHRLAWDLWSQGYWPPGQSLWTVPFYLALGGTVAAGLQSSLGAFVLCTVVSVRLLVRQYGTAAWLPTAVFLLLVATSPFFLAYASVAMSEMPGALVQAAVLLCHARYEQTRDARAARWFAIALTALFFTKYNYFVLLAVPLATYTWLAATAGMSVLGRLRGLGQGVRAILSTPTVVLLAMYAGVAITVELTGGFAFSMAGHRVAFRTIGYSAHPVLYALLGRMWYLHRRGRIDWASLWARDPRIRPLATWFVLPVTLWLASPFPNHIKDAVNLIVNIPMGEPTARMGLATYLEAARADYFLNDWFCAMAVTAFGSACWRFGRQPPLVQLLILTAVWQFVLVTAHQTRDPRFLLLAMPPLWLVSASELGAWAGRARRPVWTMSVAALAALGAMVGAQATVRGTAFQRIAAANYVASPALLDAFAAIRQAIGPGERIAVLGRRDAVSPGLVRWHLGPPAGESAFPVEILRVRDVPQFDHVDLALLVAPAPGLAAPPDVAAQARLDSARLHAQVAQGAFALADEWAIDDLQVSLRLFRRTQPRGPR